MLKFTSRGLIMTIYGLIDSLNRENEIDFHAARLHDSDSRLPLQVQLIILNSIFRDVYKNQSKFISFVSNNVSFDFACCNLLISVVYIQPQQKLTFNKNN